MGLGYAGGTDSPRTGSKFRRVPDVRIAALCLRHGVTELWSTDRDFSRFPALRVVNPLLKPRD